MDGLDDLTLLSNEPVEIPHAFKVELHLLVLSPHRFSIDGLNRAENEEISQLEDALRDEDDEIVSCAIRKVAIDFEDMRNAANLLALVGVVTKLHTWISRFTAILDPEKAKTTSLIKQINILGGNLGCCDPTFSSFFREIVNVRDSFVHGNSRSEWEYVGKRTVARRYRRGWEDDHDQEPVQFSEADLQEAVTKATRLVAWYGAKLAQHGKIKPALVGTR